jgi:kynurenine formamidase
LAIFEDQGRIGVDQQMKIIDLSIPLGIGTPPWPTYEPLQVKYFKRLAPNGANGQLVTHSNHIGTHLDGEIHFYTPGKDIASLDFDFLFGPGVIVDLSDACGDYEIYTSKMVEERADVHEGDILLIHTGYHRYGWDQPSDEHHHPRMDAAASQGSRGCISGQVWQTLGRRAYR